MIACVIIGLLQRFHMNFMISRTLSHDYIKVIIPLFLFAVSGGIDSCFDDIEYRDYSLTYSLTYCTAQSYSGHTC